VAICTTLVRYAINRLILGCQLGHQTSSGNKAAKLVEEVWLLISSTLLLGLSTWASEHHNKGCSLMDQTGCFDEWPNQQQKREVTVVSAVFVGWYVHGVVKSMVPGIGLRSGVQPSGSVCVSLLCSVCCAGTPAAVSVPSNVRPCTCLAGFAHAHALLDMHVTPVRPHLRISHHTVDGNTLASVTMPPCFPHARS
jgi:hypothetical protein